MFLFYQDFDPILIPSGWGVSPGKRYFFLDPSLFDPKRVNAQKDFQFSSTKRRPATQTMKCFPKVDQLWFSPLTEAFLERKTKSFEAELARVEATIDRECPSCNLSFGTFAREQYQELLTSLRRRLETFLGLCETRLSESEIAFQIIDNDLRDILRDVERVVKIQKGSFLGHYGQIPTHTNEYIPKKVLPILQALHHILKEMKASVSGNLSLRLSFRPGDNRALPGFEFPLRDLQRICLGVASRVKFEALEHSRFSSPFISLSPANVIICCLPGIQKDIGPVIPSLSGNRHFTVNISSFIHNEVRAKLTMENGEQWFSVTPVSRALQPISVFAKVPVFEGNRDERLEFSGQLELFSGDAKPLQLPLRFHFHLFPLQLYLISERYPLVFDNGVFWIRSPHFHFGESVVIRLHIPHFRGELRPGIAKNSRPGNEVSEAPVCEVVDGRLEMLIPRESNRIHAVVQLRISEQLLVSFGFNSLIETFDFSVKGYDQQRNEFLSNEISVVATRGRNVTIRFHVWLGQPRSGKDVHFTIRPNRMIHTKIDFDSDFTDDLEFDFDLNLQILAELSELSSLVFDLIISDVSKSFRITFTSYKHVSIVDHGVIRGWRTQRYEFTKSDVAHWCFNCRSSCRTRRACHVMTVEEQQSDEEGMSCHDSGGAAVGQGGHVMS
jgi:hypothetical protein